MDEALAYAGTLENALDPRAHQNLIGHEETRRLFELSYQQGRFAQAWLLQGAEGVGKASFAWNYARQLVHFGAITDRKLPQDVMERFARGSQSSIYDVSLPPDEKGGFKAQISVDQIRTLNEKLALAAPDGGWRVVIVDPAEAMNQNAANAFLKLLEEPPQRVVFLLVSHAPHKLLPTIHSRCQKLRFQELATPEMQKIWPLVSSDPLPEASQFSLAEGSMRMALSMSEGMLQIYQDMVFMVANRFPQSAMMQNAAAYTQGNRADALERANVLFQLFFGRLARIASGLETGNSSEVDAALIIKPYLDRWAALSIKVQNQLEDCKRLNLQIDANIMRIWFEIREELNQK